MNRRPFDARMLSDIMRHANCHATESLNSLGNLVDHLVLLLVMRVEQQVQLIKRVSRYLPVMLFVHLSEHDGIRQHLVQVLSAFQRDAFIQTGGKPDDCSELLDDLAPLAENWRRLKDRPVFCFCMCHSFQHVDARTKSCGAKKKDFRQADADSELQVM